MKSDNLSPDKIIVPEDVLRPLSKVDDDLLLKSIESGGIQQPLVVIQTPKGPTLVEGLRRLRCAKAIGLAKVPVVYDEVPKGEDPDEYRRRIRFILDHHRQDLLPSQKAELIETLKKMFSMNHRQVSAYLGIDTDSVTNWLAVRTYIPPVVEAMDQGWLTMQGARVFDGMTEEGQNYVLEHHSEELCRRGGGKLHKKIRAQYPPAHYPAFYRDAKLIAQRLARTSGKRKSKPRVGLSSDEKKKLLNNYELKEQELADLKKEMKEMKAEISAAVPIVAAIMRNEKLLALVPVDMCEELERFAEIFV